MKTKVLLAVVALSYAPLVMAGGEAAYPKEKVAAFVVEKMDLTSLPSRSGRRKKKERRLLRITVLQRRRSTKMKPSSRPLVE